MNEDIRTRQPRAVSPRILMFLLLGLLTFGHIVQLHIGLADNGDFSRLSTWVTSQPEGFSCNWPEEGTAEHDERFWKNVVTFWKLDLPMTTYWVSSVLLLWLPGVLLNVLLFSTSTLYLPFLSFAPRAMLLLFLWAALRWIRRESGESAPLYSVLLGIPFVLFAWNTDYVAFFTSFYQEPASLTGVLFIIMLLGLYAHRGDTPWRPWLSSAGLLFLTAAKISNLPWACIGALLLIPWSSVIRVPKRLALYLVLVLLLPAALPITQASLYGTRTVNAYHSIFYGALLFSEQPWQHLARHDMRGAMSCMGLHGYTEEGRACMEQHAERLHHTVVLDIIAHEPAIAWKMMTFAADSMQQVQLIDYGKNVLYNLPGTEAPFERWLPAAAVMDTPLNAWTRLKASVFPRGESLLLALAAAFVLFVTGLRSRDRMVFTLTLVGLLLTLGGLADMWMQVFGDGQRDIDKHLFLANIAVDGVAMLLPLYLLRMLQCVVAGRGKRSWMEEWKQR
jgi:hypothetical protein